MPKFVIDQDELMEIIEEEIYRGKGIPQDGGDGHQLMYEEVGKELAIVKCLIALHEFVDSALKPHIEGMMEEE